MARVFEVLELSNGAELGFGEPRLEAIACTALERLADRSDCGLAHPTAGGQFAAAGRARRLVLTHLPPGADAAQARELAAIPP